MDTAKAANLLSTFPDELIALRQRADRQGQADPGKLKRTSPARHCGTGSETTGIDHRRSQVGGLKTGIASRC